MLPNTTKLGRRDRALVLDGFLQILLELLKRQMKQNLGDINCIIESLLLSDVIFSFYSFLLKMIEKRLIP